MTYDQDKLYWREWGKAVRYCREHGFSEPDRHELHARALGRDKSHLKFTNRDFDEVLKEFRAISDPNNIEAQKRLIEMPKIRLRHRIRELADEPYLLAIVRDRFKKAALEDLDETELEQLRNSLCDREAEHKPATLARRRAKRQAVATADPDWNV